MVLAAALGGFIALGRDFYQLWLGSDFSDCYALVLILIIPVTFPMIQNVTLSILRAENRMVYRTVTLAISCVCNVTITYIGIKLWGYWGAALGTACSTILNLILMNGYYHRVLHFRVLPMFFHIMKGILPAAVLATIASLLLGLVIHGTWISFVVNAIAFLIVYGSAVLLFGLKPEEKAMLLGKFARRRK